MKHVTLTHVVLYRRHQLIGTNLPFQSRGSAEELQPSAAAEEPVAVLWQRSRYGNRTETSGLPELSNVSVFRMCKT